MRGWTRIMLLLAIVAASHAASGQAGRLDVAVAFAADQTNSLSGTQMWLQGGTVEVAGHLPSGLAVAGDVTGLSTGSRVSKVPLSLVTATFGPRYTWLARKRAGSSREISIFGECLIGTANGFASIFPGPSSVSTNAFGFALKAGGGVEAEISNHIAFRVSQANWLRTQLPNSTTNVQDHFQPGAGIVFRVGAVSGR